MSACRQGRATRGWACHDAGGRHTARWAERLAAIVRATPEG